MSDSDVNVRKKQILNFLLVSCVIFALIMLPVIYMKMKNNKQGYKKQLQNFHTASKPQKIVEDWKEKLESANELKNKQLSEANKKITAQQELISSQAQALQELSTRVQAISEAQKILTYQQRGFKNSNIKTDARDITSNNDPFVIPASNFPIKKNSHLPQTQVVKNERLIEDQESAHNNNFKAKRVKHIKLNAPKDISHSASTYIPAGSFLRSIVLGGMMAGAGTESQAEPRPMLLRVLDFSQLPNKVRRNVKDCTITAAGFGDISSQRAFIRTHKMSCIMQDNTVFEEKIHAYIAGDDSMSGVHGTVIRNEFSMVQNAFLSGLATSGGNVIQQSLGSVSTSPLGSVKTNSKGDMAASLLAGGLSGSASELQKYFVDLARQHHPIIEVTPGQEVTVVLLEGFNFKGAVR